MSDDLTAQTIARLARKHAVPGAPPTLTIVACAQHNPRDPLRPAWTTEAVWAQAAALWPDADMRALACGCLLIAPAAWSVSRG